MAAARVGSAPRSSDCAKTRLPSSAARSANQLPVRPCRLVAAQPGAFPYRLQAVQAYAFLTQLDARAKRYPEAVAASRRGLELLDGLLRDYPAFRGPQGQWLQQIRQGLLGAHARGLLGAGSRDEAVRAAGGLDPTLPGWPGGQAYNVGCLYALLAAGADGSVRDELAGRAMTWLKKAAAGGYPGTPGEVEHVRVQDDDLKSLRDRPEFREWAKDLKPAKGK